MHLLHSFVGSNDTVYCDRYVNNKELQKEFKIMFTNFIGIDVAKNKIDVFNLGTNKHMVVQNTVNNIAAAFKEIEQQGSLVVLENTGGYENRCVRVLHQLGFAIHKTENRSFKHYIGSLGQNAKTDLLDSKALAQYGKERHESLKLYKNPEETLTRLKELGTYLDELKQLRIAEGNRFKSAGFEGISNIIAESLESIDKIIAKVQAEINQLVEEDEALSRKVKSMIEYKGIASTTAINLVTYLSEIGTLSKRKLAALSGLAPYARESGTMKTTYTTSGSGRPRVKRALYMASLSAVKSNPQIAPLYKSLLARGKPKKVALVACMRKMIIHLNAIVRKELNTPSAIVSKTKKQKRKLIAKKEGN